MQPHSDAHFGEMAIKLGFTTLRRVDEVLALQEKKRERGGAPLRMGELMIRLGYLTEEQVRKVLLHEGAHHGHEEISGYRLISKLGHGSTGSVYKAVQLSMDRTVAIKVLASRHAADPVIRNRFLKQARASARLTHANLIQGIDVNVANGLHYSVMEFVDGPSVAEILRRGGPLEEKRALGYALQAARALDHAYRHGILHGDLRPKDLLVTRDGLVKMCGLGFPALASAGAAAPYYRSPEQVRGEKDIDTRTDIYSLGAILFHMETGDVPFPGTTAQLVAKQQLESAVPIPRSKNPAVSAKADWLIRKMLSKARELRHATPAELQKDLEALTAGAAPQGFSGDGGSPGGGPGRNTRLRRLTRARRYQR
jgi:eukaryotic-like serine/threonine-protein kinase